VSEASYKEEHELAYEQLQKPPEQEVAATDNVVADEDKQDTV
jgi:hypothetical protein